MARVGIILKLESLKICCCNEVLRRLDILTNSYTQNISYAQLAGMHRPFYGDTGCLVNIVTGKLMN